MSLSDPTLSGPSREITLSVDAMGGDLGARAVIAGCALSADEHAGLRFILHGPEEELAALVLKRKSLRGRCEIRNAETVVTMEDKPSHVMRHGKGTSMWATIEAVRAGEADAVVSCGNTGALMALSMIRLRRLPGVNRPAIAVLWPSRTPQGFNIMLDVGADVRADATDLLQYAFMGAGYAQVGLDIARPRVGLLNVGTEENKGRAELKEAFDLIAEQSAGPDLDFVGFVEGGDIPGDRCDVIVTDGFTGNIALKTGEGTASLIGDLLKASFKHTVLSRLASLLAITSLGRLRKRIDPRRVNGGVFLGLNGTVVKSHGSADATGVAAAIKLAVQLTQSQFTQKLADQVATTSPYADDHPQEMAK